MVVWSAVWELLSRVNTSGSQNAAETISIWWQTDFPIFETENSSSTRCSIYENKYNADYCNTFSNGRKANKGMLDDG